MSNIYRCMFHDTVTNCKWRDNIDMDRYDFEGKEEYLRNLESGDIVTAPRGYTGVWDDKVYMQIYKDL